MFSPSPFGAATTASADFCRPVPTLLSGGSTPLPVARRQTSQGKTRDLRAIHLSHLQPHHPGDIGLRVSWPLALMQLPHMRFLFVRPALCLQLPSDPASRRRPCCSASGSHHQGPQRTSTSKSPTGYQPGQTVLAHHAPCSAHHEKSARPSGRAQRGHRPFSRSRRKSPSPRHDRRRRRRGAGSHRPSGRSDQKRTSARRQTASR